MTTRRFFKRHEVLTRENFSAPTLWRKVKEKTFPAPVKIGIRGVAWVVEEIEAWELARISERDSRIR
jgi:prophage regulatory protein